MASDAEDREITLDDLLPPSDAAYEPPADLVELFDHGSPLFEEVDVYKFEREGMTKDEWRGFKKGYKARMLDVCLKTGREFRLYVANVDLERLRTRAEGFGRTVQTNSSDSPVCSFIHVSGHRPESSP